MPLMNFTDSSVLNVRASSSASLITTAGGVSGSAQQLADRHPQDQRSSTGHPLGAPAFGRLGDQRIDRRQALHGFARQRRGERSDLVGRRVVVRPLQLEVGFDGAVDIAAADVPLIQDLERRLAGAAAAISSSTAVHGSRHAVSSRDRRPSRSPPPPLPTPCWTVPRRPARALPRPSSSSARRTSSARRSSPAAAVSPCDTAEAMYSKCGVAPRIRQPRQTIAWNRPRLGRAPRRNGISNAPGTCTHRRRPPAARRRPSAPRARRPAAGR